MNAPAKTALPFLLSATREDVKELFREVVVEERESVAAQPEPLLFTCSKLCAKLGVSRASIFRWRGEGMPSIRAGDEFRYVLAEVIEWLRGRK